VVEGEIDDGGTTRTVAVKILNQNASLEDKARFLDEGRIYRDIRHENILAFISKCLNEDPWIMICELCPMVS
jgi:serine/threonine protein kinase